MSTPDEQQIEQDLAQIREQNATTATQAAELAQLRETVANVTRERDEAQTQLADVTENRAILKDIERLAREERDTAIADLNTLKEFFDANPTHLANKLRAAIAERDEARGQLASTAADRDEAREIIREINGCVDWGAISAGKATTVSEVKRTILALRESQGLREQERIKHEMDRDSLASQLDAARTMIRTGAEQAEVAETLAAERETELTAQLDQANARVRELEDRIAKLEDSCRRKNSRIQELEQKNDRPHVTAQAEDDDTSEGKHHASNYD